MSARLIGEIVAPIMARAKRLTKLQEVIRRYPHANDRKTLITMAYEIGAVSAGDAKLLIEAEGLETA